MTLARPDQCSWSGCTKTAAYAIRFHGQYGHVHECSEHQAVLREWADVSSIVPLPCPWGSHETSWIDYPKDLI